MNEPILHSGVPDSVAPIATLEASRQSATPIRRVELFGSSGSTILESMLAGRPAFIAISPTVDRPFGQSVRAWSDGLPAGQVRFCTLPAGEPMKTLATVEWVVAEAHGSSLPRDGVFVGIGGGVLLDIVGLVASLYRRGVPHIKVGTTLVAQVDAAIGLKCGVNSHNAKNLLGSFYPPELVLTDGTFLRTLKVRDIRCGLAEMIKLGIVYYAELFHSLSDHGELLLEHEATNRPESQALVDRAIVGMVDQLNENPYEALLQRPVDYGHTIGGVLEIATGHDLAHGEAVALDMALFAAASTILGSLEPSDLHAILTLLQKVGLAVRSGSDEARPAVASPTSRNRATGQAPSDRAQWYPLDPAHRCPVARYARPLWGLANGAQPFSPLARRRHLRPDPDQPAT